MNEDSGVRIKTLKERLERMWDYMEMPQMLSKLEDLDKVMEAPEFWGDNEAAQKVISERNSLKSWADPLSEVKGKFDSVVELLPEAEAEEDQDFIEELLTDLSNCEKLLGQLELRRMLSGEMDEKCCYLSINSGAGGTEACDWVAMLSRMYQRWASSRNWKVEIIDMVEGEVAGIKSVTLKLEGPYAYGYSKAEKGVHRLVRISPFDSGARRHTSFAAVDVSPEITDDIKIEVRSEDIRVDTYRASGAGGQHVNKTDSAVRITHNPTGIVVTCQNQRSQFQNKETAMQLLRSRLYEKELEEREKSLQAMSGDKSDNAWGSQIRNYVFQPYTLVKDTRTGHEVGNVQGMMDGDFLDEFVEEYLKKFAGA